eukprot:COSAG05_NODE_77_length_21410_cov_1079.308573_15_plen_60_part_00
MAERKTDQQVEQAPFGCMWFHGWSQNVHEAERQRQQATVVFKMVQVLEQGGEPLYLTAS